MRIAFVGTRGVPARYGGFETAAEEIGARLVDRGHDVTVYCRYRGQRLTSHRGMRLVNLPALRLKSAETLTHTALSAAHLYRRPVDVAVLFNAANAPFIPAIQARGIPVAVHVDGLEWKRSKWGPLGRRYYLLCERFAARRADALIADARAIGAYYQARYGREPSFLPYGAPLQQDAAHDRLGELGLTPRSYHLVVARLEPENHVEMIIDGFHRSQAEHPLVVVGSAPYGDRYIRAVHAAAASDDRIRFVGGIWDQQLLDELYAHAATYIHGHSVGGTNPSLLRAMGAGAPVLAFDVAFNREVLGDAGTYFSDPTELAGLVEQVETTSAAAQRLGQAARDRAGRLYRWSAVAEGYEELCRSLARERGPERAAA